ncbi:hypothetical protein GCM10020295_34270 [Streptomyces cinereospinus]
MALEAGSGVPLAVPPRVAEGPPWGELGESGPVEPVEPVGPVGPVADGEAVPAGDGGCVSVTVGSGRSAAVRRAANSCCAWSSSLTALSYDTTRSKSTNR